MAAKGLNRYCAICFMVWILCLLPSMSCATPLQDGHQIQTSEDVTSSPFQGPSIENTAYGAFSTESGTSVVTEAGTCDTTLENGPKNKTRKAGERVSLTCDLKNVNNRRILWRYVSETGIRRYISINEYSYDSDKYKVDIDEFFQKYKLVIKDLKFPNDSGTYECGYDCESTESYIPLASAVVTVMQKFIPSPSCRINLLPSLQSEADDGTFEIICFWTHGYEGNAHFLNANGEDVQIHLTFPGLIISRIKASKVPNITCHFMSSTSSSEKWRVPCIGNKRAEILRVDPFISEVTVNSDATFNCSFSNQSYSYSGYWKIHYGANASLVRQENLIENQKVISIVNVSQSHQSILVECALNVSDNEKISSFGAIRIAKMTTTPPDENPTLWKTNNISKTTTDISESKPTTITMLPESTSISVTSPRTSVATTTTDNSKSTRPTNVTRMLSEALSISVTSPLASVATTINDISESTRSNTATRMLSEATTITVTTPKKSVVTSPKIATPQRSDLPSCKIYTLPVVRSDYINRDYEIACSWNHSQAYQVQLQRSNDETIDNYLTFPDHIISRVNFSGDKSINCRLSFSNTSTAEINIPCIEEDGLIRVDPFVVEVDEGSSALFTCSFNDEGRRSKLSWRVNSSGNLSAVDHDRTELHPNVKFAVYKQKDGEYVQVVCHFQWRGNNMSSYGLLRIIEGTTSNLTTPSGESQTNQITDSQSIQTVKSTTNQNDITQTRPQVKMTTKKLTASSEEGQTSQIEFTRDQSSTAQPTSPSKKGLVVMISISVLVAVVILLLSLAIVYLLRKQKRISLPSRLSEEDKTDTIELSNIPHILHEESSEWYALSFKDKRVQDIQEQQSNDLIVKHHDESDQNIPILSSSLGIPSLHLLESIDENLYAEPDVSEEPIRQTISRQQCTFTPLLEDEQ